MENTQAKKSFADGKVVGIAIIVLAVLTYLLPSILLAFIPVTISNIVFFSVYLIAGLVVGLKAKYNVWGNALLLAIVMLFFSQIAIVPSGRLGIESVIQYSLVLALPLIIGTLIGHALKRK